MNTQLSTCQPKLGTGQETPPQED